MKRNRWGTEEKKILRRLRPKCSHLEISKVLTTLGYNRTKKAIRRKSEGLGLRLEQIGIPDLSGFSSDVHNAVNSILAERISPVPSIKPTIVREANPTKSELTTAYDWLEELVEIRKDLQTTPAPAVKLEEKGLSLALVISDVHIGRVITDETGRQAYNVEIALSRIQHLSQEVSRIVQERSAEELVILLVGDIADGADIFPGQSECNHTPPLFQIHLVVKALWDIILTIRADHPDLPIRITTCRGNHGRISTQKVSNWDNIVYQELELAADICKDRKLDTVTVYNNFDIEYNTVEVRGWKLLLRHKAPAQADTAAAVRKFSGWYGIHHWDAIVYGHWHHWGIFTWNSKPIFRNGSVIGGDPYSETLAVYDDPTQLVIGITEDKLPEFITPIVFER
jgi:hypothetical protein